MPSQAVVVGAGAAGDAAALAMRHGGFEGGIVLIGADPHRAYQRPFLSKEFLRGELEQERVFLHAADAYAKRDIEWLPSATAVAADRSRRSITLDSGRTIHYDTLVLATGGTPRSLPGAPRSANVLALRTLDDSVVLRRALQTSRRLLVVGAGFIGAEVAASARTLDREVLMVEAAPTPLGRALGEEMGEAYAQIHRDHGVDLRTGTTVTEWITTGDRVDAVVLSDGRRESVDLVLIAVGIEPDLTVARALGLELDAGGVAVDTGLRAAEGIFCAGDIAAHLHPLYGRRLRVEHWQVAREHGRTVGRAVAGAPAAHEDLPWFWSDQYDVKLQVLGAAGGYDRALWRGGPADGRYSIFYLRDGMVQAVLAVNDARTIRYSRALISRRRRVDPRVLEDTSADLKALAES